MALEIRDKMKIVVIGLLLAVSAIPQSSKGKDSNPADANMEKIMAERLNSMEKLKRLGVAILLYSGENKGKYPENLDELKSFNGIDLDWILRNVCYIKVTGEVQPEKILAFDKTILLKGDGTDVLYNDGHVEFVKPAKLAALGIRPGECVSDKEQNSNTEKQEKKNGQIVLKIVGPEGTPLKEAKVYQYYSLRNDKQQGKEYVCDNNGLINLAENEVFQYEWQRKSVVLYGLYEEKITGFINVSADDLGKELELKLTPACMVSIKITSTELNNLGQEVNWTSIIVLQKNDDLLSQASTKGEFEFLLPAGDYNLYAHGMQLYSRQEPVSIQAGQKELQINLDLPADRLAHLIGKEAPELRQIKGWINIKPIKLTDLHGKVVLLDFWGTWCGPCVQAIPDLIDLSEKYHDKGLVIIGIHDDSMNSIKELEKKIGELSKDRWNGQKIPFPIALDGGGMSKIEGTQKTTSGATTAAYGIQKWPTMVLIDKQGKVVKEYNPGGDTEVLEKLLAADTK